MGVGAVRNTRNGKVLLVTGRDLPALLNRHRAQLRFASHPNRDLQTDWDGQGPEGFEFVILDTLPAQAAPGYDPTEDLRILEELWLEKLNPYKPGGYHPAKG